MYDYSVLGGRYQLLGKIGEGSMGNVYLAYDLHLDKTWAVKEISREAGCLFQEWEILKNLDNPGLPKMIDLLREEDYFYLVMDYVEGRSLKELGGSLRGISQRQIVLWGIQLSEILTYLHGQSPPILYRDLKPSNVILQKNGTLKLIDFGIAMVQGTAGITGRKLGWGTKGYASPQQREGADSVQNDLHALGAVLLYLLRVRKRKANRQLLRFINKCMCPEIHERYKSAGAAGAALREILEGIQRNTRLRRGGLICALAGCLLLEYGVYGMKREQERECRRGEVRSLLESRREKAWEELQSQLGLYSIQIDWEETQSLLLEAEAEAGRMPDSFQKAERLLSLANAYLSYGKELKEGEYDAGKKAEELLLWGWKVSEKCPGDRLSRAYMVEFLEGMALLCRMEGKEEEAEDYQKKAVKVAEDYWNQMKGRG